jgi:hypothetical protein
VTNNDPGWGWYQHQGNGKFTWVTSTIQSERETEDGHFKVIVMENDHDNGFIERRVMTATEQEYSPDMVDEWRDDVVTPDIARERALLVIAACDEIDQLNEADNWQGVRPPSTGGTAWGPAHIEAIRKENERTDEWVRRRDQQDDQNQAPAGPS